ncbi:MAG: hypothetical protein KF900_14625 [Bacteroidetes bacterium]|nr:hypothetical protein [Bacteroidota bacterium]
MKPLKFFIIVSLLASNVVFGQTDSTAKKKKITEREFGMNVYAMEIRAGDFYTRYKTTFGGSVFNGLYYKAYYGKNVMRYSINYFRGKQKDNLLSKKRTVEYPFSIFQLSVGYQRMFTNGKFAPYVFGDVSMAYYKDVLLYSGGTYPWYDDYRFPYPYYQKEKARTGLMYSVSTGAGARIKLGKYMMVNVETAVQFYFSREPSDSQFGSAKAKRNIIGINGKPLTLGLAVLF